jgi:hypothetical protein
MRRPPSVDAQGSLGSSAATCPLLPGVPAGSRRCGRGARHGSTRRGPRVPWPAPRTPWPSFYRSGDTCRSTGALTAHPARSVHEGCASVARRGTNLLAGRGTARTATAGTRPPSGERADGGLRTGRGPGTGEATPTHAPAGPFTRHGGLARPFPDDLPPDPVSTPGMKAASACAGTGTVHARKGDCAHDLARPTAFHPANPPDDCPAGNPDHQICRPTCRPRPGRSPGQRRNVPAGGDRGL